MNPSKSNMRRGKSLARAACWVFSAVYRMPSDQLQRFYAERTNARDRLALLGAVARVPWPSPSL